MSHSTQFYNAFILHTRPYRDTSLLVDFFTLEKGRLSAVVRGARRPKSPLKGLLQPFVPLLISWFGKNDLVTLKSAESNGTALHLSRDWLMSALYVNELLVRLLERYDSHKNLYYAYAHVLHQLSCNEAIEPHLRTFELTLLQELGYGLGLNRISETDKSIHPDQYYYYSAENGLLPSLNTPSPESKNRLFIGKNLLRIHQQQFMDPETLRDAKRLLRRALQSLLGYREIHSRNLFYKYSGHE